MATPSASRYSINLDGVEIATFLELSGIVTEVDESEYWNTKGDGLNEVPAKSKPPLVTLIRGKDSNLWLWRWHDAVWFGTMVDARKSVTLIMYSSDGSVIARYWLENAWPSHLEVSGQLAGSSEVLYESITLACDSIARLSV
jgi:phage tail-like protein